MPGNDTPVDEYIVQVMETGMHPIPRQRSLTIEVSVSTTGDCIPQRPKQSGKVGDHDRERSTCFRCGLLPLLVITFCSFSTMLTLYENTTVMNYLRKTTSMKVIIVKKEPIPIELPDHIKLAIEDEKQKHHRPFPRWGSSIEEEETNGIDFHRVIDFVVNSSSAAHEPGVHDQRYIATSDHGTDVGQWYPEVLYDLVIRLTSSSW